MNSSQLSLFDVRGDDLAVSTAQELRETWSYLPSMSGSQALAVIVEIRAREKFSGLSLRRLARWEEGERAA